jgi:hypothetical protein
VVFVTVAGGRLTTVLDVIAQAGTVGSEHQPAPCTVDTTRSCGAWPAEAACRRRVCGARDGRLASVIVWLAACKHVVSKV